MQRIESLRADERIRTIDALRGIAALSVCWFHYTFSSSRDFLPSGALRSSGKYAFLGVEIFFVISGFVVPYAMFRARYRLTDYWRFIGKRILRLEPAYFAAIAATLVLDWLSSCAPGFRGKRFHIDAMQVLTHLTYTTGFTHYDWLNAIFWTLAIEFQFYVLVGLLFPLIVSRNNAVVAIVGGGLAASAFAIGSRAIVFHFMFLFLMGIVTFRWKNGLFGSKTFISVLVVCFAGAVATLGAPEALAGLAAAVAISFVEIRSRVLLYFGTISYSLYLLHTQIGGRVINLSLRWDVPYGAKIVVIAGAFAAAIVAAHIFHVVVERAGHRWARSIRYRDREVGEAVIETPEVASA